MEARDGELEVTERRGVEGRGTEVEEGEIRLVGMTGDTYVVSGSSRDEVGSSIEVDKATDVSSTERSWVEEDSNKSLLKTPLPNVGSTPEEESSEPTGDAVTCALVSLWLVARERSLKNSSATLAAKNNAEENAMKKHNRSNTDVQTLIATTWHIVTRDIVRWQGADRQQLNCRGT